MMAALIRKIVKVAPAGALAFILILVGVLSSVASDAGYLILIPLGAAAFISVGRHPLAGMAAAFAGVGAIFGVNLLITPDRQHDQRDHQRGDRLVGGEPLNITANYYFGVVSSIVLAVVAAVVTTASSSPASARTTRHCASTSAGERAGRRRRRRGAGAALRPLRTARQRRRRGPADARHPGRRCATRRPAAIIGATPFMDSLIFIIALIFLDLRHLLRHRAPTRSRRQHDVVGAIGKTYAGLGGLLLMFLMIAQFIAFFNYTQLATCARRRGWPTCSSRSTSRRLLAAHRCSSS